MQVPAPQPLADDVTLTFCGAAGTVTGSRYLLTVGDSSYLLDCGLFQGPPRIEQRDWEKLPFEPSELTAVILSHAHIDHSGFLPRLITLGFEGPVFATPATCELLALLLPDSGHLQEEQARYANKRGYSRHRPAQPLYTVDEATAALDYLRPLPVDQEVRIDEHLAITTHRAGHILGSSVLECHITSGRVVLTLVFSGDLGRFRGEFMRPPALLPAADYVLVESTYGNRLHPTTPARDLLEGVVKESLARGGMLLIPAFAVDRVQQLLYYLRNLQQEGRIPALPIYVDSPMAVDATAIYGRYRQDLNPAVVLPGGAESAASQGAPIHLVRSLEGSKALNERPGPGIIISASGMCEGGRILHHLAKRLPDPRNTILLVGYQAKGTRGRALVEGAPVIRLLGRQVPVAAAVRSIDALSAHADRDDLITWLRGFKTTPRMTFAIHGEDEARAGLLTAIRQQLGWPVSAPDYLESVRL